LYFLIFGEGFDVVVDVLLVLAVVVLAVEEEEEEEDEEERTGAEVEEGSSGAAVTLLLVLLGMASRSASNSSSPSNASIILFNSFFESFGATDTSEDAIAAALEVFPKPKLFFGLVFFFTTDVLDAFAPFDDPLELFDDFALLPKKEDAPVFFPFNFFKGALERDDEEDDDDEEVDRSVRIGSAI
jgi:hypothetical protein